MVNHKLEGISSQMTHMSEQLVGFMLSNSHLEQRVAGMPSREWLQDELAGKMGKVETMGYLAELQVDTVTSA